jgi:hypothetical protein
MSSESRVIHKKKHILYDCVLLSNERPTCLSCFEQRAVIFAHIHSHILVITSVIVTLCCLPPCHSPSPHLAIVTIIAITIAFIVAPSIGTIVAIAFCFCWLFFNHLAVVTVAVPLL